MRIRIYKNSVDISDKVLVNGTEIVTEYGDAAAPVDFWDEITVEPYDGGDKIFGGYVTGITRRPFRTGPQAMVEYDVVVQDYMVLLTMWLSKTTWCCWTLR